MSDEEEIQRIAYFYWENAGRPDGMQSEHWAAAEKQYESQLTSKRRSLRRFSIRLRGCCNRLYHAIDHPIIRHPLIYGLLLMIIGGFFLKTWEQNRAIGIATQVKKNEEERAERLKQAERERAIEHLKREKSVDFMYDVAPHLNKLVSSFYGWIRKPNDSDALEKHADSITELYYHRFAISMKSDVYLKPIGVDLYESYRALMVEAGITHHILLDAKKIGIQQSVSKLTEQSHRLFDLWQLDDAELKLNVNDNNNPSLEQTLSDWESYIGKGKASEAEIKHFYGRTIEIANLFYDRIKFVLKRSLQLILTGEGVKSSCNNRVAHQQHAVAMTNFPNSRRSEQRCQESLRHNFGCDSAIIIGMQDVLRVAGHVAFQTQGGAGTRTSRACLPWAIVCNAVGVKSRAVLKT